MGANSVPQIPWAIHGDNRFIAKLSGYSALSDDAIAALEEATSRSQSVATRVDLIREGDKPGPTFVVLQGWACRYKILPSGTRQILAFLMPGDSCDLNVALLAEMDHSIQTISPAVIAKIGQEEMDLLMQRHPCVARALYKAQLVDEGTLRAWITCMGRRTSIERVAHLLCELSIRLYDVNLPATRAKLPLSQQLLADALGMTPVHLNRVIKELRLSGAIALQRGSLEVVDACKLARIAGFDENYLHRKRR